jgi:hypothetical protein
LDTVGEYKCDGVVKLLWQCRQYNQKSFILLTFLVLNEPDSNRESDSDRNSDDEVIDESEYIIE